MKDVPEISPELRGLLAEIVADPRTALRFAPRRALRSWFDSGETIREGEVSGTWAERHLIEAYREELAELLCEASRIAFCKSPVMLHRTVDAGGAYLDPASDEPSWRSKAARMLRHAFIAAPGLDLLRSCLGDLRAEHGFELAKASLSLVPSDRTRDFLAVNVPWQVPHLALAVLKRIEARVPADLRVHVLRQEAARLSAIGEYLAARGAYQRAVALDSQGTIDLCYAINLSCFLGDDEQARLDGGELARRVRPEEPNVREAKRLIRQWISGNTEGMMDTARKTAARVSGRVPESVSTLFEAYYT